MQVAFRVKVMSFPPKVGEETEGSAALQAVWDLSTWSTLEIANTKLYSIILIEAADARTKLLFCTM